MANLFRIFALIFAFVVCSSLTAFAAGPSVPPPPRPQQVHPDIFGCGAGCDLQQLDPLTLKLKQQHAAGQTPAVVYRLVTMPGCNTGLVPSDLQTVSQQLLDHYGIVLARNDTAFDFTVRVNCGNGQISVCGSVNVFCLGRGYPYDTDVDISDVISSYYFESRISILCHEICGHALQGWNEQYCVGYETAPPCAGLAQFSSAPAAVDIMNTGPDSRHLLGDVEDERFWRTMWQPLTASPPAPVNCQTQGFDPCSQAWIQPDGWAWRPSDGYWLDPKGGAEFSPCNTDGLRWSPPIARWVIPGQNVGYDPSSGIWAVVPAC